jgi:hypothetical protein
MRNCKNPLFHWFFGISADAPQVGASPDRQRESANRSVVQNIFATSSLDHARRRRSWIASVAREVRDAHFSLCVRSRRRSNRRACKKSCAFYDSDIAELAANGSMSSSSTNQPCVGGDVDGEKVGSIRAKRSFTFQGGTLPSSSGRGGTEGYRGNK